MAAYAGIAENISRIRDHHLRGIELLVGHRCVVNEPGEFQLVIAAVLMLVAGGLIVTWFWTPF
jgi:hypothetical protein